MVVSFEKLRHEPHTKGGLIYRHSKALCSNHQTLETITDFETQSGTYELECGCRRPEGKAG